uniref:Uncharacterized protein n=1 Tax=Nelumbo nucifera TaxID=4432 RepID=A0A822XIA0_NELNU|nr:TPA_asm: hypothetical protein HUJ06_022707 [Nelumbo nucifera]
MRILINCLIFAVVFIICLGVFHRNNGGSFTAKAYACLLSTFLLQLMRGQTGLPLAALL